MNIIYETAKERGATILMPTAMVDAMNPGGLMAPLQAAKTPASVLAISGLVMALVLTGTPGGDEALAAGAAHG